MKRTVELVLLAVVLSVSACVSPSQITYIKDMQYGRDYPAKPAPELHVQKQDRLTIHVYSSDPALVGAKILERGLTEKSLRDGYMDFGTVDDDDNFILTARDESSIFYYTIKCRALLRSVLKYGMYAAVLYLIGVVVLLLILFRGYTQEAYEGIATVKDPDDGISSRRYEDLEAEDDDEGSETVRTLKIHLRQTAGKRLEDKARNSKLKDTLQKLRKKVKWDEQGPEGKAAIVFRAGLTLLLIGWGNLIVRSNLTSKGYGTMANFLLHGDWVKGVNLFSVCSVILIISLAYLVNVISALVLKLLSTFLLGKGQTLCKLIHNAIKYLSVFVSVYFMLQYFGFPIGTTNFDFTKDKTYFPSPTSFNLAT